MLKKLNIPVPNPKPASTRKPLPVTPSKPKSPLPAMLKKPAIATKPKPPPPAMLKKPTISTPNPKPASAPKTLLAIPSKPKKPALPTMLRKSTISTPNSMPASAPKTLQVTPTKPKPPPYAMLKKPPISTPNPKSASALKILPATPTNPKPPQPAMLKNPTISTPNSQQARTPKSIPITPSKPKPSQPAMLKKPTISITNPKPSSPETLPATPTKLKPPQPAMLKKLTMSTPNPLQASTPKTLPATFNKPIPPVKKCTVSAPSPKATNTPGKLPVTPTESATKVPASHAASRASKPDTKTLTSSGAPIGKPTPKSNIPRTTANVRAPADRNIPTESTTASPPNSALERSTEVQAQPRPRSVKPVTRSQHLTPTGNDFQDDLQQEPRRNEMRSFWSPHIPADTEANSTSNDSTPPTYLWNTFPPPPPELMDESPAGNFQSTHLTSRRRFPGAWSIATQFMRSPPFGMGQNGQQGGFDVQPTHPEASYQSFPMYRETPQSESTPASLPAAYTANRAEIEPDFTPSPVSYSPQYRLKKRPIPTIAAIFSGPYSTPDSDSGIGSSQEQPQNSVSSGKDQSEERSEHLDTEEYTTEEQEKATEEQELSEEHQYDLALNENEVSAEETEAEIPSAEDDENLDTSEYPSEEQEYLAEEQKFSEEHQHDLV